MPVYEYACKACGEHLEVSQSFKDEPLTTCPVCEGPLRKVFGSIGVILKGSGFYRTDSRLPSKREKADKASESSSGEKSGDKADKSAEKAGDKSGDKTAAATTESKPAAKSSDAKPSAAAKTA